MDGRYSSTLICTQGGERQAGGTSFRSACHRRAAGQRRGAPLSQQRSTPASQRAVARGPSRGCGCERLTWLPPRGFPPATANRWDDPRTGSAQIAPIRASTSRAHSILRQQAKARPRSPPAAVLRANSIGGGAASPCAGLCRPHDRARRKKPRDLRPIPTQPPAGESGTRGPSRLCPSPHARPQAHAVCLAAPLGRPSPDAPECCSSTRWNGCPPRAAAHLGDPGGCHGLGRGCLRCDLLIA